MFDDFFILQTEICASNRLSGCKEIDKVSDELRTIYQKGQVRIVEDVGLSVNTVENIVSSISPENFDKTPEVRKFSSKTLR